MVEPIVVPEYLRRARLGSADGRAWLDRLPELVADAFRRWDLEPAGPPYDGGMCGWTAPVRGPAGDAVLKITWPHPEAATEASALRWWRGAGAARLLAEDAGDWALLLERCEPGTPLRDAALPVERGLVIAADLLRELWAVGVPAPGTHPFPSMREVCDGWADLAESRVETYGAVLRELGTDTGILRLGIDLLRSLTRSADREVIVHGDFNPGNLLAAERRPYLAVDPKPMLGDPAYDPWQLVAQLDWPLGDADADSGKAAAERIRLFADLLDLPPERIAAWGVARDVEGGLWAAAGGDPAAGATWIRSAALVAPLVN